MNAQQIVVDIVCSIIAFVALAAAVLAVATGQLETQGVDALFLIAFCLLVAGLFSWIPLLALRKAGLGRKRNMQAGETRAAAPVATAGPRERL